MCFPLNLSKYTWKVQTQTTSSQTVCLFHKPPDPLSLHLLLSGAGHHIAHSTQHCVCVCALTVKLFPRFHCTQYISIQDIWLGWNAGKFWNSVIGWLHWPGYFQSAWFWLSHIQCTHKIPQKGTSWCDLHDSKSFLNYFFTSFQSWVPEEGVEPFFYCL